MPLLASPSRLRPALAAFAFACGMGAAGAFATAACSLDWSLDAANGADAGDAASPLDGGGDAAVGSDASVDAGAPAFTCDGALLCDTFDDGPLTVRWTDQYLGAGGDLRIVPLDAAVSVPNVLFARRPAATGGSATYAYAIRRFAPTLARMTLSFKVRPETWGKGRACIAGINFADGTATEHGIRVLVGSGGASLQEKRPAIKETAMTLGPALGRWSAMSLAVEVSGRIVVRVDDTVVLDVPADASWASSNQTLVFVGINFEDLPADEFRFDFDDLRVDGS